MDGMNDMLGSILSDPESMKQIQELADMLRTEDSTAESGSSSASGSTDSSQSSPQQSGDEQGLLGGIDIDMLMKLGGILSSAGGSDKDRDLLLALRPHVNEKRRVKIDKAVKLLKLYAVFTAMKNSGMLNNLDSLL